MSKLMENIKISLPFLLQCVNAGEVVDCTWLMRRSHSDSLASESGGVEKHLTIYINKICCDFSQVRVKDIEISLRSPSPSTLYITTKYHSHVSPTFE